MLTLCVLGILAALILYFVAQKFKVEEDPRIDEVEKDAARCELRRLRIRRMSRFGRCGTVKRADISSLFCPVGGAEVMKTVAAYLGKAAPEKEPQVATVRCGGSCEKRPRINAYDGVTSCAVAASLYGGETGCTYGCLGYGDCVTVCNFDAIAINPETRLPEVDFDKCTACGALCQGLSQVDYRVAEEVAQAAGGLRRVHVERQRGGGDESLQSRLYRLRKV